MGTVNIEWVNLNDKNSTVGTNKDDTPVDLKPISYADGSFQRLTGTTTSSTDSDNAPADTTHALVTSVEGSHYVRIGTAPASTTGGVCVMSGGSRLLSISPGNPLKVVLTA
jgi:hypothetical protein